MWKRSAYKPAYPKKCSIFTAEAFAIKTALERLLYSYENKKYKHEYIIIFSDCQGVLKALDNNKLSAYHNRYIESRKLYWKLECNFNTKIFVMWVPSHPGLTGNELADILAKQRTLDSEDKTIEIPRLDPSIPRRRME